MNNNSWTNESEEIREAAADAWLNHRDPSSLRRRSEFYNLASSAAGSLIKPMFALSSLFVLGMVSGPFQLGLDYRSDTETRTSTNLNSSGLDMDIYSETDVSAQFTLVHPELVEREKGTPPSGYENLCIAGAGISSMSGLALMAISPMFANASREYKREAESA